MKARVVACLVRDTFRQAWASRVSWLMLAVSTICVALCLSLEVERGVPLRDDDDVALYGADNRPLTESSPAPGHLRMAFGGIRLPSFREPEAEIALVRVVMAEWVAGALGTLLALVWTAGFLPEFLQPGAATLVFAKPVKRAWVLLGKYAGVVVFVAAHSAIFVMGTWLALGLRTDDWTTGYLWSLPLLVGQFAVIFAASVLIAAATRSTTACAFGSVVFWVLCYAMNVGRHAAYAASESTARGAMEVSTGFRAAREAGYWILPKPADFGILLDRAVGAGAHLATLPELDAAARSGAIQPMWSMVTSMLFAAVVLGLAVYEVERLEY